MAPSMAPGADLAEAPTDAATEQRRHSLRQAMADFFRSQPPPQARLSFPSAPQRDYGGTPPPNGGYQTTLNTEPTGTYLPAGPPDDAPGPASPPLAAGLDHPGPPRTGTPPAQAGPAWQLASAPAVSGAMQIHNAYIVASCEDGLIIVDQHALHERVLYNEFRRRLAQGRLEGQRLLIPQVVQLPPAEADLLLAHADLLARLGIELASFGPQTLAIQQFPALLAGRDIQPDEFLREVADRLGESEQADPEQLLEGLLQVLACKGAVKAGQPLSGGEIDRLLAQREQVEKASSCPHGRPTTLCLTLRDLEKQFHRT